MKKIRAAEAIRMWAVQQAVIAHSDGYKMENILDTAKAFEGYITGQTIIFTRSGSGKVGEPEPT
ncbi:hypothetical protein LCGC14_1655150 [marine sediment metagenome]|uniref:Uncharacterized protein n=1 Tax=marine sediment metagenome TaxID=412755 RepID=A0A0F9HWC2_9ZZZZ